MESHSDYDYKDLLKESNEAEKEHKKDLRLFVDLLCKYKITIKWIVKHASSYADGVLYVLLFIPPMMLLLHIVVQEPV